MPGCRGVREGNAKYLEESACNLRPGGGGQGEGSDPSLFLRHAFNV